MPMRSMLKNKHTVYIGSHGDREATNADIVLPGPATQRKWFIHEYRGRDYRRQTERSSHLEMPERIGR